MEFEYVVLSIGFSAVSFILGFLIGYAVADEFIKTDNGVERLIKEGEK